MAHKKNRCSFLLYLHLIHAYVFAAQSDIWTEAQYNRPAESNLHYHGPRLTRPGFDRINNNMRFVTVTATSR